MLSTSTPRERLEAAWQAVDRAPPVPVAALAAALHALIYGLGNRFPSRPPVQVPLLWIDQVVPIWPWTVYVYLSSHLLVFTAFVACRERGARARFAAAFFATVVSATAIHWLFPMRFPREAFALADGDGLGATLLWALRAVDRPESALPSLHVAAAAISCLSAWAEIGKRSWPWWVWSAAVAISTMTLKQHALVDVVAGAALATMVSLAIHAGRGAAVARPPRGGEQVARAAPAPAR